MTICCLIAITVRTHVKRFSVSHIASWQVLWAEKCLILDVSIPTSSDRCVHLVSKDKELLAKQGWTGCALASTSFDSVPFTFW